MDHDSIQDEESLNLCKSILTKFGHSKNTHHQIICLIIGSITQELNEEHVAKRPISYLLRIIKLLNARLVISSNDSWVAPLLTLLSIVLPKVSVGLVVKQLGLVKEPVVRALGGSGGSEEGVVDGMKVWEYLIVVSGNRGSWSEVSELYDLMLSFVTDERTKVRDQSHLCIKDVLQNFQNLPVLMRMSERIKDMLTRHILLAGYNDTTDENPIDSGSRELGLLHILDALKVCLPFMSSKVISSVLKYYKSLLLESSKPLATRRVSDSLYLLCLHPNSVVAPGVLLDLLISIAASLNKMSADSMTFTARLLDVGIRKVYSLDREVCIRKLDDVFRALGEILAYEHEEAIFAAMEAFKNIIDACIDEGLINEVQDIQKPEKTIILRICDVIESLLGYEYNAVWDMALQVVSAMFEKLGTCSSYLLKGTLASLADMQKLTDEDMPCRKQLHDCIGSALGAMRPESFLSLVPLSLESDELSEASVWLFPILKHHTAGSSLSFFAKSILGMVGAIKSRSRLLEQEGRIFSSRGMEAFVYSLWSLLPAFCNYPVDTASSFKDLQKSLCSTLRDDPEVRGVICCSLQILIKQNKSFREGASDFSNEEISISERRARAHYTPQVAVDNLEVLKSSARDFLSILTDIFLGSSSDSGGILQSTIGEFASISDRVVVHNLFKITMMKLLKVTQSAVEAGPPRSFSTMEVDCPTNETSPLLARTKLMDLALSLLPGINAKEVELLFTAIKPALQDCERLVQKKAYKILSIILKERDEFLSTKLNDLLHLMIEVLPSCDISAKHHRLDCLYFLIVYISKDTSDERKHSIISAFLTEIILALKEANKKTRNRAYDMLVQIGHACGDEEQGGKKENLHQLFTMVAGGLASDTPQMISAAVKGLARLAYEFSDLMSAAYNVLPSAYLLLQRKNREIAKANLGLLKVLVAKSPAEGLESHLKTMVEGLLKWQDDTKNHFKAKVKLLFEMLIKKCGHDAVKAVMPEEHMKLLTNIRKIKVRKERKLGGNSEVESRSAYSKATTSRHSRWNHTKIFSEFGDDDSENNDTEIGSMRLSVSSEFKSKSKASKSRSKVKRRGTKSLPEDFFDQVEDHPLDLLDRKKTRSALRSLGNLKRKQESDDEPEIDSEGRMVIHEGDRPKKDTSSNPDTDTKSRAGSRFSSNSEGQKKRRKTSELGWAYTGKEYASKKAGGDVKKKDKLEPYAYWPLDRKMMSRRPEHRAAARKGMSRVVQMTKQMEGKSVSTALSTFKKKTRKIRS